MQKNPCQVAFIGAGYMGREHAGAFTGLPGVSLAGVMSRTRSRAEALAGEFAIEVVADNIAELYERTRAQLVVVAVPELAANEVLREASRYPWLILAEKPVGYCLRDAEEITRVVRENGSRLFVALNRRFYGATEALLESLHEDEGARFIEVFDQEDMAGALAYGVPGEVVRNWMYANSIHIIDYLRIFGRGRIERIERVLPWSPDSPGHVVCAVHFESGDLGLYHAVWNGPGPWACVVSTPKARWEMRPLEQLAVQKAGERRLTPLPTSPLDERFKPGLRRQAEEAVKEATIGASLSVSLDEANKTMQLVHGLYGV